MADRDEEDDVGVGDSDDRDSDTADGLPADRGESNGGGRPGDSCPAWRRQYLDGQARTRGGRERRRGG